MFAAGIIAEYNPFHSGHAYHIQKTRALTGCQYIVVAMNGSFSQRGEPMALTKWTRAEAALLCGADAVIELPALYGVRPAEGFARGGVRLLSALGCVEALSFGCETDDMPALLRAAEYLRREPEEYSLRLRAGLAEGKSFARARGEALGALGVGGGWLMEPNAALAVEYLKENARLARPMRPFAVLRSAPHGARELAAHTSASAIREALSRGDTQGALACVPEATRALLRERWPREAPREQALDDLLLFALRSMPPERLAALPDVAEGLEGRILPLCRSARSRADLLSALKCKRYPRARLSRILAQALIGGEAALVRRQPDPPYARLIGFRKSAAPLIARLREGSAAPLIDRPKALGGSDVFALETRATDARALICADPSLRSAGQDYSRRLIVL